ncbi:MAG: terpene cyclase/mutase family protein [Kiritimatiellae bacterium]|nr:terpene cyclase/mutase family protein [Kiritimatiellia bacterium]
MDENNEFIDIKALGEKFEEKGYFSRLIDMFKGLGKPKNSPEYKLARLELQRQQAPLIAIVSVVLLVVVLIVVTQITKPPAQQIFVTTVEQDKPDEEEEQVEEEPPPPDPPEITPPDITLDVPNPGPPSEMAPTPSPPSPQVSVSPAPVDSVHNVVSPVKMRSMVQSRNPGAIGARTGGGAGWGDPTTEACVMKVLWWLKATQKKAGYWGEKKKENDTRVLANTALAVLTYLAHGEYPGSPSPYAKDFGPVVQRAIDYIMKSTKETPRGVKMEGSDANEYAFLICTYALCEAFGMTKNPDIKDIALVCLDRIVKNQSPTGGWDYHLDKKSERDDVSYAGWAIQALKAGKMAGLKPDGLDECIKKAIRCLQTRSFDKGTFHYTVKAGDGVHPGLAGVGCLAMQLLGYGNLSEVASSLNYMRNWKPSFESRDITHEGKAHIGNVCPQYYCYYATQCKYQAGMKEGATKTDQQNWFDWNKAMKAYYPSKIINLEAKVKDWSGQEHKQGYFKNTDKYTSRPYMDTCLVALQLMVYYRYLPTTQTAAAKEDTEEDTSKKAVDSGDVEVVIDDF